MEINILYNAIISIVIAITSLITENTPIESTIETMALYKILISILTHFKK